MKADKKKMFPIKIDALEKVAFTPFPTFIHLKLNDRFVPVGQAGDSVDPSRCSKFKRMNGPELWVPNGYRQLFEELLGELRNAPEVREAHQGKPNEERVISRSDEAVSLVADVFADEELSSQDRAQILSAVSQDALRALNQISKRGDKARAEGMRSCNKIVNQIIQVASANSNIYDEILSLRTSQEEIDHSVMVGTMAVMFALSVGFDDETLLADMAIAAMFHDIGLVDLPPALVAKREQDWTESERHEYTLHVAASIKILKESGSPFHPRVLRMIAEHHENYDGSGFPAGLRGAQIDETSQLLHFANLFDRCCVGKETGAEMSPAEAFAHIEEIYEFAGGKREIEPELVLRVLHFMATEKEAADEFALRGAELSRDIEKDGVN